MSSRQHALRDVVRDVVREIDEDRLLGRAAETAFFVVLAVFPGLLVTVGLLGLLEPLVGAQVAERARDEVVRSLEAVLTEQASGVLDSVRSLFDEQRGGLVGASTLGALVSLSGAFAVAVDALNTVHDSSESRSWWRRRLLGLGLAVGTLVLAALALTALVVGPLLGQGERLAALVGLDDAWAVAWDALRLPLLGVALVGWAAALQRVAPARTLTWRQTLPGALLTAALWVVVTLGFRLYLEVAAGANPVLGAFGGGAIVMSWVYLLSLSLLLGGELDAVLLERRQRDGPEQLALPL